MDEKLIEKRKRDAGRKRHKYDTDPEYRAKVLARNAAWKKKKYHNDPAYRAKILAKSAVYAVSDEAEVAERRREAQAIAAENKRQALIAVYEMRAAYGKAPDGDEA